MFSLLVLWDSPWKKLLWVEGSQGILTRTTSWDFVTKTLTQQKHSKVFLLKKKETTSLNLCDLKIAPLYHFFVPLPVKVR